MSNSPSDILDRPPQELLIWVKERLNGSVSFEEGFNWHGLAEAAAMRAHGQGSSSVWAEIAVRIYSWLAQGSRPNIAKCFTYSEMHVRAHQISSHGASIGHLTRDLDVLIAWFYRTQEVSYVEARAKTENWQDLPVSEIAKLRDIKNRLGVFEDLLDQLSSLHRDEFQKWMELRPHLP